MTTSPVKSLFMIETTHGGTWFALTYMAAFILAALIMICQGIRKGYPRSSWFLIMLTGVVFFIIGDKMFTFSPDQWKEVFTGFHFPKTGKKTVLGGLIGIFAGIYLAKTWLRFKRPVLDTLAIALPVAMAISRIGCLMAGCCFGAPTNLPWGIHYDAASMAYHVHQAQGLVGFHDHMSLAVHPNQLYQVIGCLVIAFIVWRSRNYWLSNGSLFLFSLLCYLTLRFFLEFVRDPLSNGMAGGFFMGLKIVQWLIIAGILPIFFVLLLREHKKESLVQNIQGKNINISILRQVLLATSLFIIILAGRRWFDPLELLTISLFCIPVILMLVLTIHRNYSLPGYRWVVPVTIILAISFMSQKSSSELKENEKITFKTIGITGSGGSYYQRLEEIYNKWIEGGTGCSGEPYPGHWEQASQDLGKYRTSFWQAGLNMSFNTWKGKYYKFRIGGNLFLGDESARKGINSPESLSIGISPYLWFEWRWIGFGGGITFGQMKLPYDTYFNPYEYKIGEVISPDYANVYVLPSFSFRAGPVDIVYLEAGLPLIFPSTSPNFTGKVGIGSGLGKSNGTKVSAGYAYPGLYAEVSYPIKDKIVLQGLYADNLLSGSNSRRDISIGIHYRFSVKKSNYSETKMKPFRPVEKSPEKILTDIDGNTYKINTIGSQVWMAEDLKVSQYRNGVPIPDVSENIPGSGRKYAWKDVSRSIGICPYGWHIPSIEEWTALVNYFGIERAGLELGRDFAPGEVANQWWSSTEADSLNAQSVHFNAESGVVMITKADKTSGLRVRCIRDH